VNDAVVSGGSMLLSKAGLLFAFYSRTLLIIKCEGPRTAIAKLEAHGQYVLSSDMAFSKGKKLNPFLLYLLWKLSKHAVLIVNPTKWRNSGFRACFYLLCSF